MQLTSNTPRTGQILVGKAVVAIDMVGYSKAVKILEQHGESGLVAHLNDQIQELIALALDTVAASEVCSAISKMTGDGAIWMFHSCEAAHVFAENLHEKARCYNAPKSDPTARRVFRVGIAFGNVTQYRSTVDQSNFAGETIVIAKRLEGAASPGGTLIDSRGYTFLPQHHQSRYHPGERVKDKNGETHGVRRTRPLIAPCDEESSGSKRTKQIAIAVAALSLLCICVWFYFHDFVAKPGAGYQVPPVHAEHVNGSAESPERTKPAESAASSLVALLPVSKRKPAGSDPPSSKERSRPTATLTNPLSKDFLGHWTGSFVCSKHTGTIDWTISQGDAEAVEVRESYVSNFPWPVGVRRGTTFYTGQVTGNKLELTTTALGGFQIELNQSEVGGRALQGTYFNKPGCSSLSLSK